MKRVEPTEFRYTVTRADYTDFIEEADMRAFTITDETGDSGIDTADDALLNLILDSAIDYWIDFTGVFPLITDVVAQLDASPQVCDAWLRHDPIDSVTKIWAINDDATEEVLSSDDYVVDKENAIIRSLEWPEGTKELGSFNINYKSGLGANAAAVPEEVKTAIKMMVSHWFEIRQPGIEEKINIVPHHAQAIMLKYRQVRL